MTCAPRVCYHKNGGGILFQFRDVLFFGGILKPFRSNYDVPPESRYGYSVVFLLLNQYDDGYSWWIFLISQF